jgi:hypothetical protein
MDGELASSDNRGFKIVAVPSSSSLYLFSWTAGGLRAHLPRRAGVLSPSSSMLVRAEVSVDLTFILSSRELPDEEFVEAVEPVLSVLLFDLL